VVGIADLDTTEAVLTILNTSAAEPGPSDVAHRSAVLKEKDFKDTNVRTFNHFAAFVVFVFK